MQKKPRYPIPRLWAFAYASYLTGRIHDAMDITKRILSRNSGHLAAHVRPAVTHCALDRMGKAESEAPEILRISRRYLARVMMPQKEKTSLNPNLEGLCKAS